jgi:hypothetical protein
MKINNNGRMKVVRHGDIIIDGKPLYYLFEQNKYDWVETIFDKSNEEIERTHMGSKQLKLHLDYLMRVN